MMDAGQSTRLNEALTDLSMRYADCRTIIRDLRARDVSSTETAYWIGVSQSMSKQIADDIETLRDAVYRVGLENVMAKTGT